MTKSNLFLTVMVIGALLLFFGVVAGPVIYLSLHFGWPIYVYEVVQGVWASIVLVAIYGSLGAFK